MGNAANKTPRKLDVNTSAVRPAAAETGGSAAVKAARRDREDRRRLSMQVAASILPAPQEEAGDAEGEAPVAAPAAEKGKPKAPVKKTDSISGEYSSTIEIPAAIAFKIQPYMENI